MTMTGFDTLLPRPVSAEPAPGACPWPAPVEVRAADDLPAEGYRLRISPDDVVLDAADPAGEHYGRQTLRQLAGPDAFRAAPIHSGPSALPCGTITDYPRFGWRGCLYDVSRHFRTKAEVRRFVDLLAAHKRNVLNLHLTDDQGWRIELPQFPELTSVGGWRASSMTGRHDGPERDGRPHGGYYTVDDLREIVAYAAARAVTVVPEVDIPGHSRAAIAAYPELGPETETPWEVWTSWGISTSLLNPSESTLEFYRSVFEHLTEIFPSPVIALGGDEVPGVTEAHHRFVRAVADHLVGLGRVPMGWDEVLDGGALPPMVIGVWQDRERAALARKDGHEVVLCPEDGLYLDHRQSDHPDEPIPVGYLQDLEHFYGFEPDSGPGVRGVQAQLWSEHLDTVRRTDYAAFPRLAAFAEVAWSTGPRDYAECRPRLREHHLPRLDALGVEYRPLDGPHPWQTRPGVPGRPR
jgi:hexosaminidase